MLTLDQLNGLHPDAFVAALGDVFEHAPWVAERAHAARPFASVAALHEAMTLAVRAAPREQQLAFVRGHPELGSKIARAGTMTADSVAEQGSLGLDRLSAGEFDRFARLNTMYGAKFGFPFIICVRRHTRDSILRQFERRCGHDAETELAAALAEIGFITRLRLVAKVDGSGKPKTDGRLSTHVLDTVRGKPAAGVRVDLHEVGTSARGHLVTTTTNSDGRTDQPLISGAPLRIGSYELTFHIGAYFAAQAPERPHPEERGQSPSVSKGEVADPAFLDTVPIRFSIAEPEGHYHVPLLATPWSYATYRGS